MEALKSEGNVFITRDHMNVDVSPWRVIYDRQGPFAKVDGEDYVWVGTAFDQAHGDRWLARLSQPSMYAQGEAFEWLSMMDSMDFFEAPGVSIWRSIRAKETLRDKIMNFLGGLGI